MNTPKKLNLLLFGVTRNTGYYLLQQTLEAGHHVTAIIRNPQAFTYTHPNLKVVKGDALQIDTFENELTGKDAVLSSLGINPAEGNKPTVLCSNGVKNILQAMQKTGVRRIICISAMPLDLNPKMGFLILFVSKILQRVFKHSYADMRLMEAELKVTTIDWTIVRPPQLKDKPVTGKYRTAVGSHLSWPFSINRADLAHYISNHITDQDTFRKTVEIAY